MCVLYRYRPTLTVALKSDRLKAQALRTINEVYATKQQLVSFVVQKLFTAGLLDAAAIANWVFSDEMRNRITLYVLVISSCVTRLISRALITVVRRGQSEIAAPDFLALQTFRKLNVGFVITILCLQGLVI